MKKIFLLTTLIFLTFFLTKCNNPQPNENSAIVNETTKDSCCIKNNPESSNESSVISELTCPKCGYKKTETMPTDVCLIKYSCDSCTTISYSKDGDCCVFCSYGTHKCPSKQED